MQAQQNFWPAWAHFLQRWGVDGMAAFFLESLGPVNLLTAQLIYAGGSLFGGSESKGEWAALGELLENKETSHLFAAFLREENKRDT